MTEAYPGASPYRDRHGRERWRYRAGGVTRALPGRPGEALFEAHYRAARAGRPPPGPAPASGQTLVAGWRAVTASREWLDLSPATRMQAGRHAERFLREPVAPGGPAWGGFLVEDLRRRHVKAALQAAGATVAAKRRLTAIRRIVAAALDAEWIETDPTAGLRVTVTCRGWRAWSDAELAAFDARWPFGTTARLVKELALTLGERRGDLAALRHDQRVTRTILDGAIVRLVPGYETRAQKTARDGRAAAFAPALPSLDAAIAAMPVRGETVLTRFDGKPFSAKALTGRMADWTRAAGLPPGLTLHGLRKTKGRLMTEAGATTREAMAGLDHRAIAHAELYSRDAEQARLAVAASDKLSRRLNLIRPSGEPVGEPAGEPPRKPLK